MYPAWRSCPCSGPNRAADALASDSRRSRWNGPIGSAATRRARGPEAGSWTRSRTRSWHRSWRNGRRQPRRPPPAAVMLTGTFFLMPLFSGTSVRSGFIVSLTPFFFLTEDSSTILTAPFSDAHSVHLFLRWTFLQMKQYSTFFSLKESSRSSGEQSLHRPFTPCFPHLGQNGILRRSCLGFFISVTQILPRRHLTTWLSRLRLLRGRQMRLEV